MIGALDVYAAGLQDTLDGEPAPVQVVLEDGTRVDLPLAQWLGPLTPADEDVLTRARGPVLDIGCGPGRHVHELARRGELALGVDISPAAVRLARQRGADAIEASIFGQVAGAGRWRTALLLDGNVGIGGHPLRLLLRVHSLLAPRGTLLVELDPQQSGVVRTRARLEGSAGRSESFGWARVGDHAIGAIGARAGFRLAERWSVDRRSFASLIAG